MAEQKSVKAVQPFDHLGTVDITVWAPKAEGGQHREFTGLGGIMIDTGGACVRVHMDAEKMRELAAALVAQSWEVRS